MIKGLEAFLSSSLFTRSLRSYFSFSAFNFA